MSEKEKFYPELDGKNDVVAREKMTIEFWRQNRTFEKSVERRKGAEEFVFYDGPPFANGMPHYGHIMISYVKDVVARYQTMRGKRVERRLGWDCHGLPAEMSAEKQLGVSGHKAIEEYGVEKFNAFCRQDVLKYSGIWKETFRRIGRWVDFDAEYRTMDLPFMESVIHNFKELYDKGLVYEDYRVLPYSWAAQTPLSNFEVNQGYRDKTDTAITVLFKLEDGRHLLVWTTTPWTLPSNLMIAVGADIDYSVMQEGNEKYILASALKDKFKQQLQNATEVGVVKGRDLVGLSYEPMFPYFKNLKDKGAFKVLSGEFVSTEDGTGIVHIAPGFGQDDFEVCRSYDANFPIVCPVDEAGCFTAEVSDYAGKQVFEVNDLVLTWLKENRKLVKREQYTHTYPFCWRTDTPLIYKAMSSWFVKVSDFNDEMVKLNENINWIPEHIKHGRFGKWLEGARDWSISRNRFWGTPIPVWKSDNPKFPRIDVFGSIAEIKEKTGIEIKDLHKPYIDEVVYPNPDDPSGQTMMRRVSDVFDCWFESGSMPYGQIHYPFENKEWFEKHFPADFIVEAIDQTRGWFYTLHVLGTLLHHTNAFKTCVCTGLIMAEDGQKLSKRLKNYPDHNVILDSMGSDALRWWLMASPIVKGGTVNVDMKGVEISKAARKALIPLWNAFYFFCLYANAEGIKAEKITDSNDVLDKYILAKLKKLGQKLTDLMDHYELAAACAECSDFLEILNNWYIRRSRARFWDGTDKTAFNTLFTVLVEVSRLMAPLMPFMTEYVYQSLTGEESVHLTDWVQNLPIADNNELIEKMDKVRAICSTAKSVREDAKLRNRLPLMSMTIAGVHESDLAEFTDLIKDEINVKEVAFADDVLSVANKFLYLKTPLIGKRLGAFMKDIMAASKTDAWSIQDDGKLSIAGQVLNADEFELRLVLKEGLKGMALPDNTAVVQLDTQVYPELEKEGIARDFVRMVQNLRKEKNLDVSDRIILSYEASTDLINEALELHKNYIMEQVLALDVISNRALDGAPVSEEIGDGNIKVDLQKA
ncbi:MAG: isoleucine--tRNA ligase [Alphaproteobacteria bacterium]|nr:isoleucine--tRNA ligase [Alphaproteobacteria bacterium]